MGGVQLISALREINKLKIGRIDLLLSVFRRCLLTQLLGSELTDRSRCSGDRAFTRLFVRPTTPGRRVVLKLHIVSYCYFLSIDTQSIDYECHLAGQLIPVNGITCYSAETAKNVFV